MKLVDLLSQETRDKLANDRAFLSFDGGWIFNKEGQLGIVIEHPGTVQHPEFFSFGTLTEAGK